MDPAAATKLIDAGLLGVFCVILLGAVIALWRRNNAVTDSVTTALINNTAALTALRESMRHD